MTAVRRDATAICASAALALAVLGSASASATPSSGVEARTLAESTVDGVDYVTREITIAPGGSTGWHYHDGRVYGLIREGTLTHDAAAGCAPDGVYPPGAPITEASGPGNVHIGRNLGPTPLVMWVLFIKPAGTPLSVDMPDPGCGFA
ncbi:cupin domain-containing protein [Mycobacterium sp. 1164985.4]|uniref:cupin domain-containing protein n=1 Tax=Mycobacterium sp. 1164985.4 TaxID=1834069 RepID=UPI0007FE8213|nr:cupin domain-containing protein [Mycobacterium sp. 1164985.4]OBK79963.1 cupin [Mycobacterium sp. 1164985.4]